MRNLSREHSQGTSLRTVHPGPLYRHTALVASVNPEHPTGNKQSVYRPILITLTQTIDRHSSNKPLHGYEHQLRWVDIFLQHCCETFPISRLHVDGLSLQVGPEQVSIQPITGKTTNSRFS